MTKEESGGLPTVHNYKKANKGLDYDRAKSKTPEQAVTGFLTELNDQDYDGAKKYATARTGESLGLLGTMGSLNQEGSPENG